MLARWLFEACCSGSSSAGRSLSKVALALADPQPHTHQKRTEVLGCTGLRSCACETKVGTGHSRAISNAAIEGATRWRVHASVVGAARGSIVFTVHCTCQSAVGSARKLPIKAWQQQLCGQVQWWASTWQRHAPLRQMEFIKTRAVTAARQWQQWSELLLCSSSNNRARRKSPSSDRAWHRVEL